MILNKYFYTSEQNILSITNAFNGGAFWLPKQYKKFKSGFPPKARGNDSFYG